MNRNTTVHLPNKDQNSSLTMLDPAVKSAFAICVLLIGVCAAMLFRQEQPHASPATASPQPVLLHCRGDSKAPTPATLPTPPDPLPPIQMATVVAPVEKRERPPAMSPNYPEPVRPTASHWKLSMEMMLPVPKASQTHIVVDGDTLAALAQRYLRSASRANEIFEANRDVLRDPALLPIGVELKIPQ